MTTGFATCTGSLLHVGDYLLIVIAFGMLQMRNANMRPQSQKKRLLF